ncbi:APC family permease [Candidatus Bathyarchaeota archaeon]|nr:APC family permease [Candidatus Bathyarchaeota archaeon]
MEEKKVFVRQVSGLVRELSLVDACIYGIFATGVFFTLEYFWPFGVGVFQGTSMPLIGLFGLITGLVTSLVYAILGSAMPRSGGDYIYQSRILRAPWLGFAIGFGWFSLTWIATGVFGGMVVSKWLLTLFNFLGHFYNNPALIEMSAWWYTPTGMFVINLILASLAAICTISMKWYRKVQMYILFPMLLITTVTFLGILLTATPSSFIENFNFWMKKFTGDANYYNTMIQVASQNAYTPPTSINLYNTSLAYVLPGVYLAYTVFAGQGLLGEVKGARSFSRLFMAFFVGVLFTSGLVFSIIPWLMQNVFGWDFLNIFATNYYAGLVNLPFELSYFTLMMCLTTNPLIMVFMGLASLAGAFYMMACCYLNASRIWLAQSLDGILPEWFVKVTKKLHAPINALAAEWVIVFIWILLFSFWPAFYSVVFAGFPFVWWAGMIPTGIAAIVFPWTMKKVYESSPASRYHPLTVVAGILFVIIYSCAAWQIWFNPLLGAADFLPRFTVSVLFFGSLVWFFLYRAYKKSKGINVDLAYKEIPPE